MTKSSFLHVADGCELHDDCFTCPLPKCRYEMTPIEVSKYLKDLEESGLLVTEFSNGKVVLRR